MDDVKGFVTGFYDAWNAHDLDGWLACCDESVDFKGPGGLAGQGFDVARTFWSLWQDAFPDCQCTIDVGVAEGSEAIQEAVFSGTHTEIFHTPTSGDIPPTGKKVAIPYALRLTVDDGKCSKFHLIFDQVMLARG